MRYAPAPMPETPNELVIRARAARAGIALRSRDLTLSLSLIALSLYALSHGRDLARATFALVAAGLAAPADPDAGAAGLLSAGGRLASALLPLPLWLLAAPLASMALQTVWGGSAPSPFVWRPARPSRDGSDAGLARLWMIVKLALLVLVGVGLFIDLAPPLVAGMGEGTAHLRVWLPKLAGRALVRLSALALIVGGLDMLVQRRRHRAALSLSPAAERSELRAQEGDPTMRARLRRRARADGSGVR